MDSQFITILQKLVEEQGREILLNTAKCKAFLSDYTCGEYKKESHLFLLALETGVHKAIDGAEDIALCKKQQIRVLQEEYSLAEEKAADVVDMITLILRGNVSKLNQARTGILVKKALEHYNNRKLKANPQKPFAVTVAGSNHIKNGIACKDASNCYVDDKVSIAVVAEGHGDSNCFRSYAGAKFAIAVATEGIKQFVKEYEFLFKTTGIFIKTTPEPPSYMEFNKLFREKLIKQTVASWNKAVMEHYNAKPFTEQELENINEKYHKRFKDGEDINKAYSTSLIAVAMTPWYWFAYHIGDGRFSVLYPDGSGEQPVIVDEKCFPNITTSISDDDILEREQKNPGTNDMVPTGVRSFLSFHADRPPPIAFFLCTDGIVDNYPVEGNEIHLYGLYRTIAITFADDGYESACVLVKYLVNEFATKGIGDDTSIAGIVNIEELKNVVPEWKEKIVSVEVLKTGIEKKSKNHR